MAQLKVSFCTSQKRYRNQDCLMVKFKQLYSLYSIEVQITACTTTPLWYESKDMFKISYQFNDMVWTKLEKVGLRLSQFWPIFEILTNRLIELFDTIIPYWSLQFEGVLTWHKSWKEVDEQPGHRNVIICVSLNKLSLF